MRTIFFTAIFATLGLYADPIIPETPFQKNPDLEPHEDELVVVERLIEMTKKQQIAQEKLKNLITKMRHNQELFLKNEYSKLHAHYMVSAAREIQEIIREYHLEHLFSFEFLEEVALFTQIGKKESPSL